MKDNNITPTDYWIQKDKIQEKKAIDLHTHTSYSGGDLSPNELINLAIKKNIGILAITDYNTIEGIKELNKSNATITESGIQIINGIELSTSFPRGTLHILGYGIDITNTELNKKMEELKNNTWNHTVSIIEQLKKDYNIFFKYDEIKNLMTKNHTLTTLDIAKLCVKNGYASSIQEAYEKYLIKANKRIRNINKELSYQSCIELISNIGGIPVLANPKALEIPEKEFLVLLKKMINCGLQGIETYHSEYTKEEIKYYLAVANNYNLLTSGGSNYYGPTINKETTLGDSKNNNIKIKQLSLLDKLNNQH